MVVKPQIHPICKLIVQYMIALACLRTCVNGTPSCVGLDNDVLLPHPENCSQYYRCHNGITHHRHCDPGTIFDPRVNETACVSLELGECDVTGGDTRDAAAATDAPSCIGVANGVLLPHATNCTLYYQCDNNRTHTRECAPESIFDPDVNRTACVRRNQGQCGVTTVTYATVTQDTAPGTVSQTESNVYEAIFHFPYLQYAAYEAGTSNALFQDLGEHCENFFREASLRNDDIKGLFKLASTIRSSPGSVRMHIAVTFKKSPTMDTLPAVREAAKSYLELKNHLVNNFYVDTISIIDFLPGKDSTTSNTITGIVIAVVCVGVFVLVCVLKFACCKCGQDRSLQVRRDPENGVPMTQVISPSQIIPLSHQRAMYLPGDPENGVQMPQVISSSQVIPLPHQRAMYLPGDPTQRPDVYSLLETEGTISLYNPSDDSHASPERIPCSSSNNDRYALPERIPCSSSNNDRNSRRNTTELYDRHNDNRPKTSNVIGICVICEKFNMH